MKGIGLVEGKTIQPNTLEGEILAKIEEIQPAIRSLTGTMMVTAADTADLRKVTVMGNAIANVCFNEGMVAIAAMIAGAMRDDAFADAALEQIIEGARRNFPNILKDKRQDWLAFNAERENGGTA